MPDAQEVFRKATQNVRPDPGALERPRPPWPAASWRIAQRRCDERHGPQEIARLGSDPVRAASDARGERRKG
jgi:hypothetical protein